MVERPQPERRGPGASPPGQSGVSPTLIICLTIIFAIGGVIMVGMTQEAMGWKHDAEAAPRREVDRLYGDDIRWNNAGCAYRADMAAGSMYFSPHVVLDETTPDPTDGKLLCDPARVRP